jgi:hypothetical protein
VPPDGVRGLRRLGARVDAARGSGEDFRQGDLGAGDVDTGAKPPQPPHAIGRHIKFRWAPEIKAVAIIPQFEVPTHKAREVLPAEYPRTDVVCFPASPTDFGK